MFRKFSNITPFNRQIQRQSPSFGSKAYCHSAEVHWHIKLLHCEGNKNIERKQVFRSSWSSIPCRKRARLDENKISSVIIDPVVCLPSETPVTFLRLLLFFKIKEKKSTHLKFPPMLLHFAAVVSFSNRLFFQFNRSIFLISNQLELRSPFWTPFLSIHTPFVHTFGRSYTLVLSLRMFSLSSLAPVF